VLPRRSRTSASERKEVFTVATKLAILLRRRGVVVLALSVIAGVAGSFHGGMGFWEGPL
jgi:hypothetical protein